MRCIDQRAAAYLRSALIVGRRILGIVVLVSCMACESNDRAKVGPTSTMDAGLPRLTVGVQVSPAMALVMVAEDQGFFDSAGVDVELKEFTAGKFALQAFLAGSLDVAISGEVPVTLAALQGHRFRIVAQVVDHTRNEVRVVARRDSADNTAPTYFKSKRRKLATSFGGGPEFFTHEFLARHQIAIDSLEIVSQKPEDMPAALVSGSIDAIAIFDPFARIAERALGDNAITFADPEIYSELYVASVRQETLNNRNRDLRAFLTGLITAERFIAGNPSEARAIVQRYTKLESIVLEEIWPNFVFAASLNDLLLRYTSEQVRWAIAKGDFPPDVGIPEFRQIVAPELLTDLNPAGVRLTEPDADRY